MAKEAERSENRSRFAFEEFLKDGKISINNFDYKKDDPELSLKKLQLLEELLAKDIKIKVISAVHPENFCLKILCWFTVNWNFEM
ncbi:MAG: hypothetical protein HW406_1822 [Candidatus Brocadiaceae bacterium]|nr:hypothetical protein [Candidatus Brocadiaceae bacterium]